LTLTKTTTVVKGKNTIHNRFVTTVTTCPPVIVTAPAVPSGSIILTLTRTKFVPVVKGVVTSYSTLPTIITTCVATPTIKGPVVVVAKSIPVIASGSAVTVNKVVETATVEHSKVLSENFESSTFAVEFSTPAVSTESAPVSSFAVSGNPPPAAVTVGSASISQVNGVSTRSISGIFAACFCMAAFLI
jgi:hypothetical protein